MIIVARDATAAAPSTIVAPENASSFLRAGSVSYPTTVQPRSMRLRAMAPPMMPSPMMPTIRSVTLPPTCRFPGFWPLVASFRRPGPRPRTRIDQRQHLLPHPNHPPPSQRAVLPVLAGIQQGPEGADLLLKIQQLVGDAVR